MTDRLFCAVLVLIAIVAIGASIALDSAVPVVAGIGCATAMYCRG